MRKMRALTAIELRIPRIVEIAAKRQVNELLFTQVI